MSNLPTHDMVNGVAVPLTPQQIADYQAQWAANVPDLTPRKSKLDIMQDTIDNLTTQLATLQALPVIQDAVLTANPKATK